MAQDEHAPANEHAPAQEAGHDATANQASHGEQAGHGGGVDFADAYLDVRPLPYILFILPIAVAYITPFYMGRCFMLTFMGKPRDEHIYEHAHESKLMYMPLVVLAIMTVISGPIIFRNFVARSAPEMPALVPMIGAGHHDEVAHVVHPLLTPMVGFAFVVGLAVAYFIYRDGFKIAKPIAEAPVIRAFYNIFWNKFYFDHVYNAVLVMGTRGFAVACGLFDSWIIDGIVNLCGQFTKAIAWFTGVVLDNKGVDGAVNGTGSLAWSIGGAFRGTHTGVIRNYILMTAIVVAGVLIGTMWNAAAAVVLVVLAAWTVAAPSACFNVLIPLMAGGVLLRLGRAMMAEAGADWTVFSAFWASYVSAAGVIEIALLIILLLILSIRYRGLEPPEPEYAAAR